MSSLLQMKPRFKKQKNNSYRSSAARSTGKTFTPDGYPPEDLLDMTSLRSRREYSRHLPKATPLPLRATQKCLRFNVRKKKRSYFFFHYRAGTTKYLPCRRPHLLILGPELLAPLPPAMPSSLTCHGSRRHACK